jgi:hypothetical protein
MNDPTPAPRRYSEKEVGLILRRATEMRRRRAGALDLVRRLADQVERAIPEP